MQLLFPTNGKRLRTPYKLFANIQQHTLMQFLPNLTSLRVLHTIQFRNEDQCQWVTSQFRKFTVDIVANNPSVQLEYIALDAAIERLVRRKVTPKAAPRFDRKGKGRAMREDIDPTSKALGELIIGLGTSPAWSDGGSGASNGTATPVLQEWHDSSDDEDGIHSGQTGLKIETIEGIRFCDVVGVRIFEKDVLSGRL